MFLDESVDGSLDGDDGVEHVVFQLQPCDLGKEALDGVKP